MKFETGRTPEIFTNAILQPLKVSLFKNEILMSNVFKNCNKRVGRISAKEYKKTQKNLSEIN